MKRLTLISLSIVGILALAVSAEVIPVFSPSEYIYWVTGQIIQAENTGVIPNVGDWNGDGLKDILVGVYQSGNIFFYPNSGTNEEPVFTSRSMLYAGASPIAMSSG